MDFLVHLGEGVSRLGEGRLCVKPGKILIFLKNGKNSKIAEIV